MKILYKDNKKKNIKLIIFDVDGTLVDDDQKLSSRTIKVIQSLQRKNVLVSLATGKIFPSVRQVVEDLGIRAPLILSNGAILQQPNGEIIFNSLLKLEILQTILDCYQDYDADLALFTPASIYVKKETRNTEHIRICGEKMKEIGSWVNIKDEFPAVCKALLLNRRDGEEMAKLKELLANKLGEKIALSSGALNSIEVMSVGVSKGTELRNLAKFLNIKLENVMAFGDHVNDIGMLKIAGVSVAVDNAIDEVKKIVDVVIKSNNDSGPAEFLEEWILSN
ncbi:MAG TPA: HAD family hydrolase [Anaerolineae bacterium]|nr:HAD family hydrolase [Anaerolineae bacterium]